MTFSPGHALRDVAAKLLRGHESTQHWLRLAGGADDWSELVTEQNNKIVGLHAELVDTTRADLGLGPKYQVPGHSLLAKLLGREQGRQTPE